MPDLLHILSADRWLYVDPETGEIVGDAPDVPTVPDDGLMDRLYRSIIPTPFHTAKELLGGVTKEKLEKMDPKLARAFWSLLLKTPVPGSARNGH